MTKIYNPITKAVQIHIADAGGIITGTEVETALQENRTAIDLNTTHRSSSGADHTYIDQDVTSGSTPTFTGTNFTGIDISSGTNLAVTAPIVLTDDTLSHSTANGYVHIPANGSSAQMLQYSSAGTAKWVTLSSDVTIADGGAVTVADDSHNHVYSNIDATTSANWASRVSDETGTGAWVFANTPTLVTPEIGAATGTSLDLGGTTLLASRQITVDTGGGLDINMGTASGDDFTIDTSAFVVEGDTGNVGIGTTGPSEKLEIYGDARGIRLSAASDPTNYYSTILNHYSSSNSFQIEHAGYNVIKAAQNAGFVYVGRNDVLTVDGSGKVGIYDATPDATLDITKYSTDDPLYISSSGAIAGDMFVVKNNGNVGIGTTGPGSLLHIEKDSANAVLNIGTTTSGNPAIDFKDGSTTKSELVWVRSDDTFKVWHSGDTRVTIDNNGNVGIGTTLPQSLLDVQGAAGAAGILTLATKELTVVDGDVLGQIDFNAPLESSGTDAILVGASIKAIAEGTFAADNNATELVFSTGASEAAAQKMVLTSAGRLGVGVASPDTIIDVNGAITFRELSADPSDPDEGSAVMWMSDGTGTGDDGDILLKVQAGSTVKTVTLVDFSVV